MSREWKDAHVWAKLPKAPMYFAIAIYGIGSAFFISGMAEQGRRDEILHGPGLGVLGWAALAVLLSTYCIWIIDRAQRYVKGQLNV